MIKYCICTFIFFTNVFFAFSQESKKDTLFILTDFVKKNDMYFDISSNIKIELRDEQERNTKFPGDQTSWAYKIPAIKIKPKNKILSDLLHKKELNNFSIGVQKNICFVDKKVKIRNKCDSSAGIFFMHRDIDYQYLEDYNSYLDVLDSITIESKKGGDWFATLPLRIPKNTYGKKIINLDTLKTSYDYSDLSEFYGKGYFFEVSGIIHLVKKYKTIYIESERIDSNTIVFEKVDYQYYSDDIFP